MRETNDLLEVDGLGDAVGQPVKGVRGVVAFRRRHESEVTRRGDDAVVAMQHAQDRESGGLERAAHLVGMPLRAGLVEDDADDAHRRVERDHALHDRGDRAGRVRDVDDEHDRAPGDGGDVGGGGEPVAADLPVVQTHDALDDRDVGSIGTVQQQRDEPFLPDEVRVEVAARSAGGEGVVAGVDVVGADLVARDGVPGSAQRRHQARGDRRLAVTGRGGGNDKSRKADRSPMIFAYHSMPFWPFWPWSKGCLTCCISVTRSAISTSLGSAPRPVTMTC